MELQRRDPLAVELEAGHRDPERHHEVVPPLQRRPVQHLGARHVGPALQRLEVEGRVRRHPRQRLAIDRPAGAEPGAGGLEIGREIGLADRPGPEPAGGPEPGPVAEIDRIERQAAPAPEVRGAAQAARHGDLGGVVVVGVEVLGPRQLLRRPGAAPAAFQQQHPPAALGQRQRGDDPHRPRADHADLGAEARQRLEGRRIRDHRAPPPAHGALRPDPAPIQPWRGHPARLERPRPRRGVKGARPAEAGVEQICGSLPHHAAGGRRN